MFGHRATVFRNWLALPLALLLSGAQAATWIPETDGWPNLETLRLQDLVSSDPLGDVCIPEDRIDLAFHTTGKGLRLPRTCLPDPCETALTRPNLAGLVGRPVTEPEWDAYFARYADYCRKEVVPFGPEDTGTMVTETAPPGEFWWPLLFTYQTDPANPVFTPSRFGRSTGTGTGLFSGGSPVPGGVTSGRGQSFGGLTALGGGDGDGGEGRFMGSATSSSGGTSVGPVPDPDGPGPDPDPEPLTVVPLPAGIWAILAAMGSLAILRYRRRLAGVAQ